MGVPKIGFIQPHLIGFGGLESYAAHTLAALLEGWPVEVVCSHPVDPDRLASSFSVDLGRARFRVDRGCLQEPAGGRLERARLARAFARLSRDYDLLFFSTVSLPPRSQARRSCLICHFPVVYQLKLDHTVPTDLLSRATSSRARTQHDIRARLDSWARVITSSHYAAGYLRRFWDRQAQVLYPPLVRVREVPLGKRPIIVSCGFFAPPRPGDRHSYKRQEILIEAFRLLDSQEWELHLTGHMLEESRPFLQALQEQARGLKVHFHPNLPRRELEALLGQASLYWHGTGHGVSVEDQPDQVEHFGISIAEAMSWGCVPLVVPRGGTPEVVGPLVELAWATLQELAEKTRALIDDPSRRGQLSRQAFEESRRFGWERFRGEVLELAEGLLKGLAL